MTYLCQDNLKLIKSEKEIRSRIKDLALSIDRDFAGEEIVVVGILKGSFIFFSDLIRKMKSEVVCEFFGTSEYREAKDNPLVSGEVKIILDLNSPVTGKNVLLVEDIVSDALTMGYLARNLQARQPAKLRTCCFLQKNSYSGKDKSFPIDYVGFTVPAEEQIVGYGVDYEGRYRNLPYVACISK